MQVTIRLKGLFRIVVFFMLVITAVGYSAYKAYRYIAYRKIIQANDDKQKSNLKFNIKLKTSDRTLNGYLLLSSIAGYHNKYYSSLLIIDQEGRQLMQRQVSGVVYDFRQWKTDTTTYYSYSVNNSASDSTVTNSGSAGHVVILDASLKEIKQVHLVSHNDIIADGKKDLDLHDFIMFSPRHYMAMASYAKTVSNIPGFLYPSKKNKLLVPVIQEVRNDSVVWQWDASNYPEFYVNSLAGNKFYDSTARQDYMHMNSMIIDPRDNNVIVSFLNLNQVVKIDRNNGSIIWRLGGRNSDFGLKGQQVFLRQHHATLTDSNKTLMLLDNGDPTDRPYSRVVEFKLNEQQKTIEGFKSYTIPERMISSRGSVQKVNDKYVICGGISNYLLVVNSNTGAENIMMRANQTFYRSYLVQDIRGINLKQNQGKE